MVYNKTSVSGREESQNRGKLEGEFVSDATQPKPKNAPALRRLSFLFTPLANAIDPLDGFGAHRLSCFAGGAS